MNINRWCISVVDLILQVIDVVVVVVHLQVSGFWGLIFVFVAGTDSRTGAGATDEVL